MNGISIYFFRRNSINLLDVLTEEYYSGIMMAASHYPKVWLSIEYFNKKRSAELLSN